MEDSTFWYLYKSEASGIVYPLEFGIKKLKVSDLCYEPDVVWSWCEKGCKNFNNAGGCPPASPLLKTLYSDSDTVWLIYCLFWSKYKHEKVAKSNNSAIHWKFQDAILARLLVNVGYALRTKFEGNFLSTGYCMGCPGKKCNYKLGHKFCRNPQKRTYSMEATGINVVETLKKTTGIEMFWYKKGQTDIPYMLKCIAYFPSINSNLTKDKLVGILNSMKSCHYEIGSSEYLHFLDSLK
ncbi:DUF2284 domain-containing protein [Desulforamulus reducens]|nr:DUF2284 domain-containing protein [Desulforamulus reducens]